LSQLLRDGEAAVTRVENEAFGELESLAEMPADQALDEAVLTEVLAAEAAHATDLGEAEALLGGALPLSVRLMGGRRPLRPYRPALAQANARLVMGLARVGPDGRLLLRLVPAMQRRTAASLLAAVRAGRRPSPALVAPLMAGHAARVLGTPRLARAALARSTATHRRTSHRG
jgi:hypothetical protein